MVFKLLEKISQNEGFRLSSADESKVLKFVEKNLNNNRGVVKLIRNDIFTKQQLIKLAGKISESEFKDTYERDHSYVYELIDKGIFKKGQF